MSKYGHLRVVGKEYGPTVEEQLAASKKFNKAAVVMMVIMMFYQHSKNQLGEVMLMPHFII